MIEFFTSALSDEILLKALHRWLNCCFAKGTSTKTLKTSLFLVLYILRKGISLVLQQEGGNSRCILAFIKVGSLIVLVCDPSKSKTPSIIG